MSATLQLNEELFHEAEQFAARAGTTVTAVIEEALREKLARPAPPPARVPVLLTIFKGLGLQPGVNLDDSATLLARMDMDDAAF